MLVYNAAHLQLPFILSKEKVATR